MTIKEILWNKYSRAIGLGLAAITVLGGIVEKRNAKNIVGTALYVGSFGIIIGSVIYSIKSNAS